MMVATTAANLVAAVGALASLLTSVAVLLGMFRVYRKVDGLASDQAARIDQLSTVIASAPHVELPARLPDGGEPPKPIVLDDGTVAPGG